MSTPKFPTFKKVFGWMFSWRLIRRVLISIGLLITLLALVWTEENVRGKMAWSRYKSQLEAKGEKLALKDFAPPKVPDDQNFAMTPLLAGYLSYLTKPELWPDEKIRSRVMILQSSKTNQIPSGASWAKGKFIDLNLWASYLRGQPGSAASLTRKEAAEEVLRGFKQYQPKMDELVAASHREYAQFPVRYDTEDPMSMLMFHVSVMQMIQIPFKIRASAELEVGESQQAMADVEMLFYFADAMKEPASISYEVRISVLNSALEIIWEGLSAHRWTDAQLADLEKRLGKFDLLADYVNVTRADLAAGITWLEYLRRGETKSEFLGCDGLHFMPSGWFYQNELTLARIITEGVLPAVDAPAHRIWPDKIPTEEILRKEAGRFFPYRGLALMYFGTTHTEKFAACQTKINQAVIACALERYHRLKNAKFPETLDALKPEFIDTVPNDIINGRPLVYRLKEHGNFILYSVGWNEKDDGGTIGTSIGDDGKSHYDLKKGDWVWPEYPAD